MKKIPFKLKNIKKGKIEWIIGHLAYNHENERYGILDVDDWMHFGLCCGEELQVMVEGRWFDTRIEMDDRLEWYLIGTPYQDDLEYIQARVRK